MKEEEQIIKEIKDTVAFTCSYWYPLLEKTENDTNLTPMSVGIINDIIKGRSAYVFDLELRLKELKYTNL